MQQLKLFLLERIFPSAFLLDLRSIFPSILVKNKFSILSLNLNFLTWNVTWRILFLNRRLLYAWHSRKTFKIASTKCPLTAHTRVFDALCNQNSLKNLFIHNKKNVPRSSVLFLFSSLFSLCVEKFFFRIYWFIFFSFHFLMRKLCKLLKIFDIDYSIHTRTNSLNSHLNSLLSLALFLLISRIVSIFSKFCGSPV